MIDRRRFSTTLMAGAAVSMLAGRARAQIAAPLKAKNIVLVHGLFAEAPAGANVIPRLQAAGLNVTSVQNPLTTLPDAVAAAERVLDRQDGPTIFVGHSFSGMIVTEAGVHPNVAAVTYIAARAPDAGEDYQRLRKDFRHPLRARGSCSTAMKGA